MYRIRFRSLKLGTRNDIVEGILMNLDEQVLGQKVHKVGVMYCRADQCNERDFYNNKDASPAFYEFMDTIGQRITLKGFDKYITINMISKRERCVGTRDSENLCFVVPYI